MLNVEETFSMLNVEDLFFQIFPCKFPIFPCHLLSQVGGPVVHLEGQVGELLLLLAALTGQVRVERLVVADFALR